MNASRLFAGTLVAATFVSFTATTSAQLRPPLPAEQPRQSLPAGPSAALCDADNGGLVLPENFCAVVVARGVGTARHMAVRPNGDLYVAIDNANGANGHILALRDTDGDARPDQSATFGPTGGNGIAYSNGQLFFSPADRVLRFDFLDDELVPAGETVTLVSGLPASGDHTRKTVVPDGQGNLYVNHGSSTNSCQVANRQLQSPGIDPCPDLAVRAGVWKYNTTTPDQTPANGQRFATELRNMNALAINPADAQLYGLQNGRDQLAENWPQIYDAQEDAVQPAEELFVLEEGRAYGWPYCYFDPVLNEKVLSPEYGGDGTMVGRCADRELPIDVYPAHWAPLSMLFYDGTQFPKRYRGGLFAAWHGSRFDPNQQPAGPGYVVTFKPWIDGAPRGEFETFADNFAGGDATPEGAAHRPVGLAQAPDGSLYVSDDKAGWIWRIFYVGPERER